MSLMLQLSLEFVVAEWRSSAYRSVHPHAHLCLVDVLCAFDLLPFADLKGTGVQIFYGCEDWVGDDGPQDPASQQRGDEQDDCRATT